MSNEKRSIPLCFVVLLLALFLSGCAGTAANMQKVPLDRIITAPEKGKSMVVFMRPSDFGGNIQSSVFEIKQNAPSLIGIIGAQEKVSYQLEPGKHLFMVTGKNADFLLAELKADKTYYALVSPIMGRWTARFSLYPIPIKHLYSSQFGKRFESCDWVEKTPAAADWVSQNMASIQSKQEQYYAEWLNKDASDKPLLLPRDGK